MLLTRRSIRRRIEGMAASRLKKSLLRTILEVQVVDEDPPAKFSKHVKVYRKTDKGIFPVWIKKKNLEKYVGSIVPPPKGIPSKEFDPKSGSEKKIKDKHHKAGGEDDKIREAEPKPKDHVSDSQRYDVDGDRGPTSFKRKLSDFRSKVGSGVADESKWFGGGMTGVYKAKMGGVTVAIKNPGPGKTDEEVRRHTAAGRIASAIGCDDMVVPCDMVELKKGAGDVSKETGERVMVTKWATDSVPCSAASGAALSKVDGDSRLRGALIHYLTDESDGIARNSLVSDDGKITMLDHSKMFAKFFVGKKNMDHSRSIFYPGGSLDYQKKTGPMKSVKDLPPGLFKMVDDLAKMSVTELADFLGLSSDEAKLVAEKVETLVKHGLDEAIKKTGGEPKTLQFRSRRTICFPRCLLMTMESCGSLRL
jgi:hypothetical protein